MSNGPNTTTAPSRDAGGLTRGRRSFLLAALVGLVGGHAATFVVSGEKLWPFSDYSLYTEARDAAVAEQFLLVGVTAGPDSIELDLFRHPDLILPHYRATHHGTFRRLAGAPDSLVLAAEDCLRLYEARRVAHRHNGPPLIAVRVYRYEWRYVDVDATTRAPTSRTLLAQATLALGGNRP